MVVGDWGDLTLLNMDKNHYKKIYFNENGNYENYKIFQFYYLIDKLIFYGKEIQFQFFFQINVIILHSNLKRIILVRGQNLLVGV
jgi:hypothetical protein